MAQYREAKTPTSSGKELDHIQIHTGEDGGYVAEHHYKEDGMMFHKPKQYVFGADEGKDLMEHVRKHMHVNDKADEVAEPKEA